MIEAVRGREHLMDAEERAALPDVVTILRGFTHAEGARGLSWTLDRERAEWFARRFRAQGMAAAIRMGLGPEVARRVADAPPMIAGCPPLRSLPCE
jgi:hypothetical protein